LRGAFGGKGADVNKKFILKAYLILLMAKKTGGLNYWQCLGITILMFIVWMQLSVKLFSAIFNLVLFPAIPIFIFIIPPMDTFGSFLSVFADIFIIVPVYSYVLKVFVKRFNKSRSPVWKGILYTAIIMVINSFIFGIIFSILRAKGIVV